MTITVEIRLDGETLEIYEAIYPDDGILFNGNAILLAQADVFSGRIAHVIWSRLESRSSGAMAWPWSQEAPYWMDGGI